MRNFLTRSFLIAAGLLLATNNTYAQPLAEIPANTRIRLLLDDAHRQAPLSSSRQFIAGQIVRVTADSIIMRTVGSGEFGVARSGVRLVQVSRGVSPGRSALASGLFLGAVVALLSDVARDGQYHQHSDALVAGGVGFGVGAIIGAISPFESWRRVKK